MTTASPCSIGMTDTRMSTSAPLDANLDAPVLRHAFLGDVEVGKNLDARDNRGLETLDLRGHRHFLQQTVDAVADAQLVLERLDVNVRRAQRKRVAEDLVDEADDARVLGGLVEVAVVLAVVREDLETFLLFELVERVRADAEMLS